MNRLGMAAALVAALGVAAPAYAGDRADDAKDTYTEKKADTKKEVRDLKPGDKTAEDRKDDAKDTLEASGAKAKKGAREVKRDVKDAVE
jgi:hypothetical protein